MSDYRNIRVWRRRKSAVWGLRFVPVQTVGALARGGVQEVRSNHQLDTQSHLDGEGEADIWINVRYLALETDPKNTHTAQ